MKNINIDFYNKNASKLAETYNSLSTKDVHGSILEKITKKGIILDIGCGSGRDAFYFAEKGFNVVAIEPAEEILKLAKEKNNHKNINYINDSLPELSKIKSKKKFDYILMSAVWMHIKEEDRSKTIKKLTSLLKPQGKMFISLRFGAFNDKRQELPVSKEELELLTENIDGFNCSEIKSGSENDQLNRDHVHWKTIVIENNNPKLKRKIKNK